MACDELQASKFFLACIRNRAQGIEGVNIELQQTKNGVTLPVRVSAGSRVSGIRGVQNGALKISVTVAPEKGKANKAVIKLLARELGYSKSGLEIVAGSSSVQKRILISGVSIDELRQRLSQYG